VESAIGRKVHVIRDEIVWGIDPGRGGDPTGFVERSPNAVLALENLRYDNLMDVAGWVMSRWKTTPPSRRPVRLYVDSNGLGAGLADRLLELSLPVVHVNVSEVASVSETYLRLRDEIWFKAREWFEGMDKYIDPEIPLLGEFVEELVSVNYKLLSSGKVQVEPKDASKKRLTRSPNLADAFNVTFAHEGAILSGSYRTGGWGKVDTLAYRAPGFKKKAS
jgi:hypothetical protein